MESKRVKTIYTNIESGIGMDVFVRRTDIFIRNSCACYDQKDISVWVQPVSIEWMCLFRTDVSVQKGYARSNRTYVSARKNYTRYN